MKAFQVLHKIQADEKGNAPKVIELLKTGTWQTPWHGEFEITPLDIQEYIRNFEKGVGLVEADKEAPINYGHESERKASGWIPKIYANESGTAVLTEPNWTPAAKQAIKDGEWRYISSEFHPRDYPWENPEQEYEFVPNVLVGAALTNIPLFKKLGPVTASRITKKRKKVNADATGDSEQNNEGDHMKLEDIRAKEVADLTAEEKTFLEENKADLTTEELTKFEIKADGEADAEKDAADKEAADKAAAEEAAKAEADAKAAEDAAKVEASVKGNVTISASELAGLKASAARADALAAEMDREKVTSLISASIKAGQIKSGEKDKAINLVLASRGDHRKDLEAFIAGLPVNASIGKEFGDTGAEAIVNAQAELDKRVRKIQADARGAGKDVPYSTARKQVLEDDKELKAQLKEEQ